MDLTALHHITVLGEVGDQKALAGLEKLQKDRADRPDKLNTALICSIKNLQDRLKTPAP
jgi:hypothetical protein